MPVWVRKLANVFMFRGRMSSFDYAVISEWFDWIIQNSTVGVDLIGMLHAVLFLELSLIFIINVCR